MRLCENASVDGGGKMEWLKHVWIQLPPAPGIMLSHIPFIWTAVQTEKLTQIQISQKSKSGFVIKSFNILKCFNWRKHKNSLRKQNKSWR